MLAKYIVLQASSSIDPTNQFPIKTKHFSILSHGIIRIPHAKSSISLNIIVRSFEAIIVKYKNQSQPMENLRVVRVLKIFILIVDLFCACNELSSIFIPFLDP